VPAVTTAIRRGVVITVVSCLALAPVDAFATRPGGDKDEGNVHQSGQKNSQEISSQVSFDLSKNGNGSSSGPLTVQSANWTPPPCWYEPTYTPKQLKQDHEETKNLPHASGLGPAIEAFEYHYVEGHPYKNYNLSKQGEGMFWDRAALSYEDGGDIFACTKPAFWVDNGDTPDVQNAVTPEVLAGLAYAKIRIPGTKVDLAPENTTKVNLATWAWLDEAKFKPVSVTASLNAGGVNIQATTTAKPVALKLEPGTSDATTFPASGKCKINEDGSIGEPWAKGKSDEAPPCGVTYLRSSNGGTYKLKATITWEIDWTGTGGAGGDLPDGTFGTTQDITVQEIQAINH
jgi:enoyl reductase